MVVVENGTVISGAISLEHPLPIADGSRVVVRVETASPTPLAGAKDSDHDLAWHSFFGLWADRTDIPDSSEFVRQEREKWHLRGTRQE
ncbi:MAG: hypothetical protein ACKVP0_09380 [Pirellulaceae bacterium]